jgi:AraC-like DNA-binding protein
MRHVRAPGLGDAELSYVRTSAGAAPPDVRSMLEVILVDRANKTIVHRGKQQQIRTGLVGLRSAYEAGRLVRRHASETRVRILAIPSKDVTAALEALDVDPRRTTPVLAYFKDEKLWTVANEVFAAVEKRESASAVEMRLVECVLQVARYLVARTLESKRGREKGSAHRIREVLHDRLSDDLSLEELASEVQLSRTYVVHTFSQEFGLSPREYLMQLRVDRARELLAAGQRPIDVAYACGFCDQSHLNRWFSVAVGNTPGAYRRTAAPWPLRPEKRRK